MSVGWMFTSSRTVLTVMRRWSDSGVLPHHAVPLLLMAPVSLRETDKKLRVKNWALTSSWHSKWNLIRGASPPPSHDDRGRTSASFARRRESPESTLLPSLIRLQLLNLICIITCSTRHTSPPTEFICCCLAMLRELTEWNLKQESMRGKAVCCVCVCVFVCVFVCTHGFASWSKATFLCDIPVLSSRCHLSGGVDSYPGTQRIGRICSIIIAL